MTSLKNRALEQKNRILSMIGMQKMTVPKICRKCGSDKLKREELIMGGKYGTTVGRGYRFDVYICEECGYSELFYRERTGWV